MVDRHSESSFIRLRDELSIFLPCLFIETIKSLADSPWCTMQEYIRAQSLSTWRRHFSTFSFEFSDRLHHRPHRALEHCRPHRASGAVDARPAHGENIFRQQMPDLDLFKPLAWRWSPLQKVCRRRGMPPRNEARLREAGESRNGRLTASRCRFERAPRRWPSVRGFQS